MRCLQNELGRPSPRRTCAERLLYYNCFRGADFAQLTFNVADLFCFWKQIWGIFQLRYRLKQETGNSWICLSIYLWLHSPLLGLGRFFTFLILYTVGRTRWTRNQPVRGHYLYTEQHKHRTNANRHPCLEWDSNLRSQCSSERRQFMP
jgi:hypothetical protein